MCETQHAVYCSNNGEYVLQTQTSAELEGIKVSTKPKLVTMSNHSEERFLGLAL